MLWFIRYIMWAACFENHRLQFDPIQVLFGETLLLRLVSLVVLQEEDTDEEVEEEETSNQDEENEECSLVCLVLKQWPFVNTHNVECLIHDVRPAFQRRDYK